MSCAAHNKQNTDAPFVDMAELKLWKEIVVVAQPALIPLRSISAGCGVLPHVMRHWRPSEVTHNNQTEDGSYVARKRLKHA